MKYENFIKWVNENYPNNFSGFTKSEHAFVTKLIDLLEEYPDIKEILESSGARGSSLFLVEQYLKFEVRKKEDEDKFIDKIKIAF